MTRSKLTRSTWALLLATVAAACSDEEAQEAQEAMADTASEDSADLAQDADRNKTETSDKASRDEAARDESSEEGASADTADSPYETSADDSAEAIDPEAALAAIPEQMRPKDLLADLKKKLLVPDLDKQGVAMFTDVVTVKAGEDVTFCTYLPGVTDKVTYIHDTEGSQSKFGHHAIMQYTTDPAEPGTRKCDPESLEAQQGQILGGTGGEGNGAIELPSNVVSEIPAGAQFIINHHWINVSDEDIDAQAEMITVPPDSDDDLVIARAFTVTTLGFDLPPNEVTEISTTCMLDQDVQLLSVIGHQHSWGTHVKAERIGSNEDVIFDHDYDESMISHPITTNFSVDEPYEIKAGDGLRMNCEWTNTTNSAIGFPREMCVFFGWQIGADADAQCIDGNWL